MTLRYETRSNRPLRHGRALLLALSVVLAFSPAAHALDLCMDFGNGGTAVLKRFRIPRAGKCTPLQGFSAPSASTIISGSGCTNAAGTVLWLQYTSNGRLYPFYFESGACEIGLPMGANGTTGTCEGSWFVSPPGDIQPFGQSVTLRPCNVDVP